jgi:drug/metabolite transporter (DMT)-like permease
VLYGAVGFAGTFGFIHWALVRVPPASVQVLLALVPLATLLLAVAQRLERFRAASVVGAGVAFAGIAVIFAEQLGSATPLASLAAVGLGALCMAESNVIVKRFPKCHPLANNAIAILVGTGLLLAVSLASGEVQALPADGATWMAVAYVSLPGTAVVFSCFVLVVRHWSASASSYVMLVMPLVTIAAAWVVIGQPLTSALLGGGALVAVGVYVRAVGRGRAATMRVPGGAAHPPAGLQPGCA